jgi:hypothetical protein
MQMGEEEGAHISNRHFDSVYRAWDHQSNLIQGLAFAVPLLSLQGLSMGLAGTDPLQHTHIAHAAEQYREQLVRIMNDDITRHRDPALPVTTLSEDYHRGLDLWQRVPLFHYELPQPETVLAHYRTGLMALGVWLLGSISLVAYCVRRVSVD